jgi:hypothetical protein
MTPPPDDGWGPLPDGPDYWDALGRLVDTLPELPADESEDA